ncbi:uncharacterized protein A4U43_C03F7310 [Asparagus officinalis]|uniref:Uncharacterized protein n=1 Tax=Asparagus officinalis TaxID=4686 RepID=A0A5P1FCF0_ASPOF|nr:uncharacterized protein LOC109833164 isoform X1 [Asparagus officinalis]ONK74529.1 uncharacterized protein A4U43_C03F7310 [Asparagus officinalis]
MAARSPSPNPSRPKTPEISNSIRRSKEFPQRSSFSKPLSPNSQKENAKTRPPAISSSKGSKNFMAPTISAASKVVSASPRKRILQERNEVISSVSHSLEFPNKEVGVGVESEGVGSKSEMGLRFQEGSSSGELKKGVSRIKNHQVSPLPFNAPTNADRSLTPYDPKINYLSPRPQFLHYRPNPRIEHYLSREGEFLDVNEGRRLEDGFSSESSEDDDVNILTEENDSEEEFLPLKVREVESVTETLVSEPPFNSVNEAQVSEPDDVTSLTEDKEKGSEEELLPTEVKEVEPVTETFVPEPEPELKSVSETLVSEPESKSELLKPCSFRRSKLVLFLLVLFMASIYMPVLDSPIISSSMVKVGSLPKVHVPFYREFEDLYLKDYLAVFSGNLSGLASKFKDWSADSIAYLSSDTQKDDFGFYHLANMTSSAVDETEGLDLSYRPLIETKQAIKQNLQEEVSEDEPEKSEIVVSEDVIEGEVYYQDVLDIDTRNIEPEAEKTEIVVSEDVTEADVGSLETETAVSKYVIYTDTLGYIEAEAEKNEIAVSQDVIEGEVCYQDVVDADTMNIEAEAEKIEFVASEDTLGYIEAEAEKNEIAVSQDVIEGEVCYQDVVDTDTMNIEAEAEKIEFVASEDMTEGVAGSQEIETAVSKDVIDVDTMSYTEAEAEMIEIALSEDLIEGEIGSQEIEMEVYEGAVDAYTVGYEMEKRIIEGDGEVEQESSHINKEDKISEIIAKSALIEDEDCSDHTQSASFIDNQPELEGDYEIPHGHDLKSMNFAIIFGLSVALSALPAMAVLYAKQRQAPRIANTREETQKVRSISGSSRPYDQAKESSSELSSSWNHTSSSSGRLSNERSLRRDSAVSSSTSYGSFTTYERLSAKKGCKDEEAMTPVRRSSRIRNLTSP